MSHRDKLEEAKFNLKSLQISFALADSNFKHCLNNFLSSAQSVFWVLNKSFSNSTEYKDWSEKRSSRLSDNSKIFKELRNVSLKEAPVKHENVIINFDFGAVGITIPPHAEVVTPGIETRTGRLLSKMATIKPQGGKAYEVEPLVIHDFSVNVESKGKTYRIEYFLKEADIYIKEIEREILEAESSFEISRSV